jgi:AmiR/NasT family two-component response regulator
MLVVSVVSGIFFKAKIEETVKRFGSSAFCSSVEEIEELQPQVIIVDLEHPNAAAILREYGKKAIAFGPHLRTDLLRIAKEFGARVYPRSIFFNQLDHLLHQHE